MADPSARITRTDVLRASPGCCAICGKDKHPDGFAATDNFDFEFYGTVYFCADCVGEYARLFGYKSPSELDDIESRVATQAAELKTLRTAVVMLENLVDNLTSLSDFRRDNIVPGDGTGHLIVAATETADVSVDEPVEAGEGEQLTLSEPSVESGSDDVRDTPSTDSSIDELLAL